jgi:hypothetical protein
MAPLSSKTLVAQGGTVLLETLRTLEVELHQPTVRDQTARLAELLHPEFREYGRSGASYTRADILEKLPSEPGTTMVWSQDFEVVQLTDEIALLTYRSAHIGEGGSLHHHANRSSLWQRTGTGWMMRFHQGTPTFAFERGAT